MSKSKDQERLQQQGYAVRYSAALLVNDQRASQAREHELLRVQRVSLEHAGQLQLQLDDSQRALQVARQENEELVRAQQAALDIIRQLNDENLYLRQLLGLVPLTPAQTAEADSMLQLEDN